MASLANLARRLNRARAATASQIPRVYVFTDTARLPDPTAILSRLPRGAGIVLRHPDVAVLEEMAHRVVPAAHRLGLKVLVAADLRLALRCGADGVHLSERAARLG
ncbi:MAG: thiamine phosphate synthase, partial [Alphaproteobacteria bacterium]|nr:thiamine phosphate synthase [Alphaproteobacteria bacterium]